MKIRLCCLFLGLLLLIPEVGHASGVVVSIKPLHSLVQGVMGDTGRAELLVGGNASPHEFQLKPSQMKMLEQADAVFYIDEGFETFLHNAFENMPKKVRTVEVAHSAKIPLLRMRHGGAWEPHEHHEHEQGEHPHHESDEDAHVWLDPENAQKIVLSVVRELGIVYPKNRETYLKNADILLVKLKALDKELAGELLGLKDKNFIVFHDAYQYFERRYGLSAVGSITFEPEESPSPKRIQQVREKLKATKAACVFREPYFSDRLVNTVTEGSEAKSGTLDPEATTLEPGTELYFHMMKALAESIHECLQ